MDVFPEDRRQKRERERERERDLQKGDVATKLVWQNSSVLGQIKYREVD